MIKKALLLLILSISAAVGFSQSETPPAKDSLLINGHLGLMGRWQTGNLNQVSVMPRGNFIMAKSSFFTALNASYHFIRVNGFNAKNDLWLNGLYQHRPSKRVYPSLHVTIGFAESYLIEYSTLSGIGVGVNIRKATPGHFLQAHLFSGYLNFQYQTEIHHIALGVGSLLRAQFPINERVDVRWELSSYHSTSDADFRGGSHLFQINAMLFKNLAFNLTHQSYYNHQTTSTIKNTNTEMLFGIQYNFSNN